MSISPYDTLPTESKTPKKEMQPPEELQYIDVPIPKTPIDDTPAPDMPITDPAIISEPPESNTEDSSLPPEDRADTSVSNAPMNINKHDLREIAFPEAPQEFTNITPLSSHTKYSKIKLKNLRSFGEYILPFEETLLVPDTMPDMDHILFAEGSVKSDQPAKSNYDKKDVVSGEITVYTVYHPASSDLAVDVIKSSVPFKTDRCWENSTGDCFKVTLSIKSISADILNERKFTVKGSICIRFTEISVCELMVFNGTDDSELIKKESSIHAANLIFETNEETEISQEINIHEEQPAPAKILKEHFDIIENHKQITAGKLVINGTILASILYVGKKDDETKICSIDNKIDFTQFIVMENDIDINLLETSFVSNSLKAAIENQNCFMIQGQVITSVSGYENKNVPIVSDAYHKKQDIKFDIASQALSTLTDTVSGEISAREILNMDEGDNKPETLLCGSCHISDISGTAEQGRIIIEGKIDATILALNENCMPFVINNTVPVRGSLEMSALETSPKINITAAIKEFWFDTINSRQLEINTGLSLTARAICQNTFSTLENICFVEKKNPAKKTSMALYIVDKGDSLWDIAKRYKSDTDTLAQINQLDVNKPLLTGTKLLVMK